MENIIQSIDEYIEQSPIDIRNRLEDLRKIINHAAPKAIEKISWGMPTFWLEGNLCHFALHKKHIGFYPGASGVEIFAKELEEYKTTKGAIQFPLNKPLPEKLITRIVKYRAKENLENKKQKNT